MFGRKFVAAATSVMLLLIATAAQAAPPSTATLIAGWSVGGPGALIVETGQVTITEAVTGEVTLSFDIIRTVACLAVPGASTTERWQATNAPATLSVKNNLSSATLVANVVGGLSVTSNCPGVDAVTGNVGPVSIDAVASTRTLRERTTDGVRILSRTVQLALNVGSLSIEGTGEIEKRIG